MQSLYLQANCFEWREMLSAENITREHNMHKGWGKARRRMKLKTFNGFFLIAECIIYSEFLDSLSTAHHITSSRLLVVSERKREKERML